MFKVLKLMFLALCLVTASATMAQEAAPSVEISLSQPTAKQGDIIAADVYIRNAVNIGGADVGITVDNQCLQIVDRQAGNFLPTASETGGYTPFSEIKNDETRLAATIIDRSKLGNGSGIFYRTLLKVLCEKGSAPVKVSFAELSGYKDPSAKDVQLVAYTLGGGNVRTANTELVIGPQGSVAAAPVAPLAAPQKAPAQKPAEAPANNPLTWIVVLAAAGIGLFFLVMALRLVRRTPIEQSGQE
jgi:hypothetical protein